MAARHESTNVTKEEGIRAHPDWRVLAPLIGEAAAGGETISLYDYNLRRRLRNAYDPSASELITEFRGAVEARRREMATAAGALVTGNAPELKLASVPAVETTYELTRQRPLAETIPAVPIPQPA
jgi:hypothetical protein